ACERFSAARRNSRQVRHILPPAPRRPRSRRAFSSARVSGGFILKAGVTPGPGFDRTSLDFAWGTPMSKSPPDRPHFPSGPADSSGKGHRHPGPLPRWRLVLVNSATADLMVIVRAIMELTHFCRTEATHKMWQAHHSGRAPLLTTHRERAE